MMKSMLLAAFAASMLAEAASAATIAFAPFQTPPGQPPDLPIREFQADVSISRNGVPQPPITLFGESTVAYQALLDGTTVKSLDTTMIDFHSGPGSTVDTTYDQTTMRVQISGGTGLPFPQGSSKLLIVTRFTGPGLSRTFNDFGPFPDPWDQPATIQDVELHTQTVLLTGIDGPWEQPGRVLVDAMIEFDRFTVTLDRFGFRPVASVTLGVPEPATWVLLAVCLIPVLMRRAFQ